MKVLITGATGLIGQEIVKLCHQSNIVVHYLTTSKHKIQSKPNYIGYYWNPDTGEINTTCFEGVETIINLAGATVAKRWTSAYKKEIIESRTEVAHLMLSSLKKIKHSVCRIVSAGAIGIYPDSFQNYYMEDAVEDNNSFLGAVCKKWESAVQEFKKIHIDVCIFRIGLVLSKNGGAFPKIAQPIRYGIGAAFGSGKQWQSWIHVEDLAKMFVFAVTNELSGVFNAVAPNPVSNEKLTKVIADQMDRKLILPNIPKFAMRIVLGEMHTLLYASQRVCSNKISSSGFVFKYENIKQAIHALVR